jgi:hypothetical protein
MMSICIANSCPNIGNLGENPVEAFRVTLYAIEMYGKSWSQSYLLVGCNHQHLDQGFDVSLELAIGLRLQAGRVSLVNPKELTSPGVTATRAEFPHLCVFLEALCSAR